MNASCQNKVAKIQIEMNTVNNQTCVLQSELSQINQRIAQLNAVEAQCGRSQSTALSRAVKRQSQLESAIRRNTIKMETLNRRLIMAQQQMAMRCMRRG